MTKMIFIKIIAILCIFTFIGSVGGGAATVYAQPGTPGDPLVSRSYLETRIAELEAQIAALTALIADMDHNGQPIGTLSPDVFPIQTTDRELFQVVRAYPGTVLIGGASTEIILRAGNATVVAGYNGLANVTAGHDIMNGQAVPLNNLLIVPQADGRGLQFHTVAYLMVKGDYHLV